MTEVDLLAEKLPTLDTDLLLFYMIKFQGSNLFPKLLAELNRRYGLPIKSV